MTADAALAREAIYPAYREKVRQYIAGKVSDPHDAEDLVSCVFLKAFEKWDSFDERRAGVSTWIYAITRNTVIDYYRTRRISEELAEDLACEREVDERLLREELLEELSDALERLNPRERTVILLHYGRSVALKEIAERMHLSYATVKLAHSDALRRLRPMLKGME